MEVLRAQSQILVRERFHLRGVSDLERFPVDRRESCIWGGRDGGVGLGARDRMRIVPFALPSTMVPAVPELHGALLGGSDAQDTGQSVDPRVEAGREAGGGINGGGERLDERHAGGFPTHSTLPNHIDGAISSPREGKGGRGCQRATADRSCHGSMIGRLEAHFPRLMQPVRRGASCAPSVEASLIGKPGLTTRPQNMTQNAWETPRGACWKFTVSFFFTLFPGSSVSEGDTSVMEFM